MSKKEERNMDIIRAMVDVNEDGKINPEELKMALAMINDLDATEKEKKELRKQAIKESFKEGSIQTVIIILGVTVSGVIMSLMIDYGLLFI